MDNIIVTQADRKAACEFYGYDDEKDLAYWGNVSNHGDVERLAAAFARHRQSSIASLTGDVGMRDHDRIATSICQTVAEIPDRSSPDDWPDVMLVTADELHTIVVCALESEAEQQSHALHQAAETLRQEAVLHLNNTIGCATNHYGHDHLEFGLPQWIADSEQRIKQASASLTPPPLTDAPDAVREGYVKIPCEVLAEGERRDAVAKAATVLAPYSADLPGTPTRDALVLLNAAINPAAADFFAALTTPAAKDDAGRLREALEDIVGTWERNKNKGGDEWEDGYEDALAECARKARAALSPQSDEGEERRG